MVVEFLGCKDIHDFVNIQGVLANCSSLGYDFVFVVISISFLAWYRLCLVCLGSLLFPVSLCEVFMLP